MDHKVALLPERQLCHEFVNSLDAHLDMYIDAVGAYTFGL